MEMLCRLSYKGKPFFTVTSIAYRKKDDKYSCREVSALG